MSHNYIIFKWGRQVMKKARKYKTVLIKSKSLQELVWY